MKKTVNVAVAIIHFGEKYLLGYRNASQHQGEKYEFIGGKIEPTERPKQGLIREVFEEIGCDISANTAIKMGVIRHTYVEKDKGEKSVALHCFKIELNQSQFEQLQGDIGKEGQVIAWVEKMDLLEKKYLLPEANARILEWLSLPDVIVISQPFESEDEGDYSDTQMVQGWLSLYDYVLPKHSWFYPRTQSDPFIEAILVTKIQEFRPDIRCFIPYRSWQYEVVNVEDFTSHGMPILHLNHQQLLEVSCESLPKTLAYFASCHDEASIRKINQLAKTHIVMGCFLSPVLPTPTHPETITNGGMGWETFAELAEISDVPVYGLGGLGKANLGKVWENNGFGVAGIRLIEDF